MEPVEKRRMPDLARAWISTTVLYLSGVFLPGLGFPFMMLAPQPGIALERRRGMPALLALVALVATTVAVVAGGAAAVLYLAAFALLTIVLPWIVRRDTSIEQAVLSATLVVLAGTAFGLFAVGSSPSGIMADLETSLDAFRTYLIEAYRDAGVGRARLEQVEDAMVAFVDLGIRLAPALAVLALAGTVLVNLMCLRWRQPGFSAAPLFGDLTRWRSPAPLVWLLIASGYCVLVPIEAVRLVAWNVLAIVLAVYFCQGVAIVHFYFHRWRSPLWMRTLLYFVVLVEWLFASAIVLLGVFDLWGDFRHLTPRPAEED